MKLKLSNIIEIARKRWGNNIKIILDEPRLLCEIECKTTHLTSIVQWLNQEMHYIFAGLIIEEGELEWELRYMFYGELDEGWVYILIHQPLKNQTFPSISSFLHAADWHEREAEDLFGLNFEGHPRLGDFVLHNNRWGENLAPMRHSFDGNKPIIHRKPDLNWQPKNIVETPGTFVMPIGPKFSGITESVQFFLETTGENIIHIIPRLFYKYRAVEKMAEGHTIENGLLLSERFAADTAFAHALAFCQAIENICKTIISPRAQILRIFLAELERIRHHIGATREICESTGLGVATSQFEMLEEELLRISCIFTGHRYLFGLTVPGGLSRTFDNKSCYETLQQIQNILKKLYQLEKMLYSSSSFLDRLEKVGVISEYNAINYGLVGPIARASNIKRDMRKIQPYCGYETFDFSIPYEKEGDGYARLRILFSEINQSVKIMEQAFKILPDEQDTIINFEIKPGKGIGWTETPRGATFHWVNVDNNGQIERYHIITPSFVNWHGFHLAVEQFTFQDFPIILASLNLSVAENDR